MSDITVVLTTSKFLLASGGNSDTFEKLKAQNIPMCIAYMGLGMFGGANEMERLELEFSEICKSMAKTVHVDPQKRYVFVGENAEDSTTGLIDYSDNVFDEAADEFFSQWHKLKCMTMEFNALDLNNKPIFSLKGMWSIDRWHSLDVYPSSKIWVVPTK